MKKLVMNLIAAVMLFSTFAFATDSDNVNARIKAAFLNDFATASDVSWEKSSDFCFARFKVNNIEVNAAYDDNGTLVGTSRAMESTQLPLNISLAVAKKYNGYTLSKNALELTFEGETRYYLTVISNTHALKLKCSTNGSIEVEKKIKK